MTSLAQLADRGVVSESVEIGSLTTYRLGGPARYLAEVADRATLEVVIEALDDEPVLILGRGSNVVISDRGFAGLVARLTGEFEQIEVAGGRVVAGGAAWLPSLARETVARGVRGLEFFVGIPGSVGGAVRQNAGGHGSETREWLVEAEICSIRSGVARRSGPDDLEMSYRHSSIGSDDLVLSATFRGETGDPEEGRELIASIIRWRREHQPAAVYNAGSVFRNPPGDSAGRIIDALGLKGFSVGGVRVSEKHANFFVATPDATASDLYELVTQIRARVGSETGIDLTPEIQFVGEFE